jgi:hypothetical protein
MRFYLPAGEAGARARLRLSRTEAYGESEMYPATTKRAKNESLTTIMKLPYQIPTKTWFLERLVYLVAGIFVLGSTLLFLVGITWIIYFVAFVGFMLIFFALTGICPMAMILTLLGAKSGLKDELWKK